jgi:type I restriction enzyme S subunit
MASQTAEVKKSDSVFRNVEFADDWSFVRLTDVARLESGHTPSRNRNDYWNGDIPWVSLHDTGNLDGPEIQTTNQSISELGLASSSARLLPKGTVVLSRTATIGKTTLLGREMATSQDFANYICGESINNRFLVHLFRFMGPLWKKLMAGSTHNTIYMPAFENLAIPLPPLPEQRAIADALSDVDALIERLDALIAKKRAIKTATMQRLLTGKQRLPGFGGEWTTKRLGDVFDLLQTANNSRKDLSDHGDVAYIHYGDIHTFTKSHLDLHRDHLPFIDASKVHNATPLQDGDLVMVDASEDYEGVGKSIEVSGLNGHPAIAGLHTFLLRGDDAYVADGFKGYMQHMPNLIEALHRIATGTSVYGISKTKIKDIKLRLPPVEEQKAIATILSDMDAEIEALEARREKTQDIKQGMMQELLTGRTRLV